MRPGASQGAFTTLSPRQELTPAPAAVFSGAAPWTGVGGKPPGFADDVDDDALGELPCAGGQVPKWSGAAWTCAADADSGGDITAVTAGTGLAGGGTSGDATVSVAFDGTGAASTVARSDHNHLGQAWSGSSPTGLGVTTTGLTGVRGETGSAAGRGMFGLASSGTGITYGVWGESASIQGRGLLGRATSPTGGSYGVWGETFSSSGRGVYGLASASSGSTWGVWGESVSPSGRGVYGLASAGSGSTYGVFGFAASPDGTGVYGLHSAPTGTDAGLHGETTSTSANAAAVVGRVTSASPGANSAGVRGINEGTGLLGIGVWGSHGGGGWGVNGTTVSGTGVRGSATSLAGVGVRAVGGGTSGTALEITSGAIRVTGAGVNTNTTAFVLSAQESQLCGLPPLAYFAIVIDHPLANGDSDAILMVTRGATAVGAQPFEVRYNVLVIKP